MRRALSILFVLFFAFGPLAASLQADDERSLPACCRRHGIHHCDMSDDAGSGIGAGIKGTTPTLSAPSRCPWFPDRAATNLGTAPALPEASALPLVPSPAFEFQALLGYAKFFSTSAHAVRGPPSFLFA